MSRRREPAEEAARLAHELANALTAIRGWATLARERPEEAARALERIAETVEAAWPKARTLAGHRPVTDRAPVCLATATEDALRALEPLAASRGVRLAHDVAPVWVAGPADELWTVIVNLVKNAVEAARSSVRVDVSRGDGTARIVVADDGPGLSPEMRARAFEPWATTKPEGTGLGLSVVQDAVLARGGTIALEPRSKGGLRVVVTLPASAQEEPLTRRRSGVRVPTPVATSGTHARVPLAGVRVLVVEDDASLRELLDTALSLRGADVVAVAGAAEARATIGGFDLAVIDVNLGAERGDRLLGDLRAHHRVTAALLVTGAAPPADADARAQPAAWLRKPFMVDEVIQAAADAVAATRPRARSR